MPVTVDLPLVPATPIGSAASLNSAASASARVARSQPFAFAATMSGTVSSTAAEAMTRWPSRTPFPSCGEQRDAGRAQRVELGRGAALVEAAVGAGDVIPARAQDHRQRHHARSADPDQKLGFGDRHVPALSAAVRLGKRGDWSGMRIGVLAASSRANPETIPKVTAYAAAAFPEVELVFHPQCIETDGHFAGSDFRRAEAFLQYANDPALDAIWFLRGGYGSNRILQMVMPHLGRAARTKTYLGYSDVGFLLAALYARRIGHSVHGPMASDIGRHDGEATVARSLGWMVRRDRAGLEPGLDGKPAVAFNLSILAALIGTPWLPDLTDHVVIVEEVSEAMYRDRPDALPDRPGDAAEGDRGPAAGSGQRRAGEYARLGRDAGLYDGALVPRYGGAVPRARRGGAHVEQPGGAVRDRVRARKVTGKSRRRRGCGVLEPEQVVTD